MSYHGQYKIDLGSHAEDEACRFLKSNGFKIIERNYRTRFAEIDIIAIHEETIVFVEVKARTSSRYGSPREAVGSGKQKKIIAGAMQYIRENALDGKRVRFDVVTYLKSNSNYLKSNPKSSGAEPLHIELISNAFDASIS
ncbi:conserved hypothetical protein [Desulfamplus magnetovallimortis]|uniref:UPF0102 protein MTBBW1_1200015 n=1 Tax=Desulfamplus magnetovallimortis TaxID=1246637 RepID=A0A1W1H621_9BACT|nr:YraN family protein [Desulfamplus magnetovallimortis]SLM27940.1 conserved hypothetical protein [Desulfamplus magnetovallimortis]